MILSSLHSCVSSASLFACTSSTYITLFSGVADILSFLSGFGDVHDSTLFVVCATWT